MPSNPKPRKLKAQDPKVIKNFDNICSTLKYVSDAFLEDAVESILRTEVQGSTKDYIAQKARDIYEEYERNNKTIPDVWEKLMLWDEPEIEEK